MTSKKIDLSEFFRYSRPRHAPCRLGAAMSQLDPEQIDTINAALGSDKNVITSQSIVIWLEKRNLKNVTAASVANHRKQTCSCFDDVGA